jgi:hypothetical protein
MKQRILPSLWMATGVALVLVAPAPSLAQALWQANGLPLCVRPTCSGYAPQVVPDLGGGVIMRWQRNPTQSDEQIYAKRLLVSGAVPPEWATQGTLLTGAERRQDATDIVPDGTGGAFVVWNDTRDVFVTGTDVYAQHVMGDGQIASGWPVDGLPISTNPGLEELARLLGDGQGGVFVVWTTATSVFLQRLQGDGSRFPGWPAEGVQLHDIPGPTGVVWHAGAVADGQGGCLVVTGDERRGLGIEIYVHRMTGEGQIAPGWPANGRRVVDASSGQPYRFNGQVVSDDLGGCYIGWSSNIVPDWYESDIHATHVLADGSVAAGWPAIGLPVAVQPRTQYVTDAAPDGTGGVLFTWGDERDYGSFPSRVFVARLRPDGTPAPGWLPQGNPMSDLPGYHYFPMLAPDGNGGGFVTYQEAFGIQGYVQRFRGDGTRPGGWPSVGLPLVDPSIASSTTQKEIAISPDNAGGAVVVWNDYRGTVSNQLYAQRYSGDGITGTLTALVRFEVLPDLVTLVWSRGDDAPTHVDVERQGANGAWATLDRGAFAANGSLEYGDRTVVPGGHYAYRLAWSDGSGEHRTAEVEVQVPLAVALALEGLRPNPAVGEPHVVFSLPGAGETTVELLDLGGRVVRREQASHLGAGRHVLRLGSGERLHPGVYWVRLRHEGRTLTAKGRVVR